MQTAPMNHNGDLSNVFAGAMSNDARERKTYTDFRDRAAYTYVTGSFPTHLRTFFTGLLRKATRYNTDPTSFDLRGGHMVMDQKVIDELELDSHPMVRKVREYVRQGYRIQPSRSVTDRRPYSKVFLFHSKGKQVDHTVTVQIDGSVLEGWGE